MSFMSGSPVIESTTNSPTARAGANEHNEHLSPARMLASAATDRSTQSLASSASTTNRSAEVAAVARLSNEASLAEARSRTVLNEFQSLLEAAQRIADNAESSLSRDSLSNDQSDPIIRRATAVPRLAQPHEGRRRVPLTRQYSGRPHVPGEDSGSEHEDDRNDSEEDDTDDLFSQLAYSRPRRADLDSLLDEEPSSRFVSENLRRMDSARAQMEAYRARDSQSSIAEQMERDRESLRQAVAMTRELRRHRQNTAMITSDMASNPSLGTRSSTDDSNSSSARVHAHAQPYPLPIPTSSTTHTRQRSRSNSVRRWRPSERLQDYASSHTRRSSRDDLTASANSAVQATAAGVPITWRNHAEGNGNIIRATGLRTHGREASGTGSGQTEEANSWDAYFDRQTRSRSNATWSPEASTHPPRTERNEHDEIVSRVERALQEYRLSRRNLRASQEDSTGYLGSRATLAELSAARASRRQTSTSFSPDLPAPFSWEDRWRRDDNARRRAAEQTREHRRRYLYRLQSTLDGMQESERNTRELIESASKVTSESMKMAKASLRYLALLKEPEMSPEKAWTTAAELGLHNRSLHETPKENLPTTVDDLPTPSVCSWLEPGMSWSGTQSADEDDSPVVQSTDAIIQDLETRRAALSDAFPSRQSNFTAGSSRQPEARDPWEDRAADNLTSWWTQQLHQQSGERWRRLAQQDELSCPKFEPAKAKDHWEVKAVLHSVDWQDMTLTGTMTASQIRSASELDHSTTSQHEGASMDSFFTGEIIDFVHFGLDTPSSAEREASGHNSSYRDKRQQNDWKVGGPEEDVLHWAGVGPFREEIDRIVEDRQKSYDKVLQKLNASLNDQDTTRSSVSDHDENGSDTTATDTETQPPNYTESELNGLKLGTMHKLLTNKKWLNEHINSEGWILMRWKERCFVSPGTGPNPEPTRPWIPSRVPASRYDQSTRSGFSFLELSRQNTQRIYSTNDAEREELNSSGSGRTESANTISARSTQPTWGLTISGFYYVALHRRTGRIEALYYDCSSAPYQRLRMEPALHGRTENTGEMAFEVPGGLRSSFNLVEFR